MKTRKLLVALALLSVIKLDGSGFIKIGDHEVHIATAKEELSSSKCFLTGEEIKALQREDVYKSLSTIEQAKLVCADLKLTRLLQAQKRYWQRGLYDRDVTNGRVEVMRCCWGCGGALGTLMPSIMLPTLEGIVCGLFTALWLRAEYIEEVQKRGVPCCCARNNITNERNEIGNLTRKGIEKLFDNELDFAGMRKFLDRYGYDNRNELKSCTESIDSAFPELLSDGACYCGMLRRNFSFKERQGFSDRLQDLAIQKRASETMR